MASASQADGDRPGLHRFFGCSKIQDYEFLGKLGEGTFGEVSKGRSKRTGQVVALKKILMHNEKDGFPITALREIRLLKMLDHVNVLKLEEMAVERPKGEARKKFGMFMVTPYMEHDLSGLLENPDVYFSIPQIKCYMMQLLEGTKYLHENKILHRDMKAANLLISNHGILQIADFGLARPYDDEPPKPGQGGGEATRDYTTLVVTRWYRPPELLLQLKKYTTAVDMWGVGCVFGEMFRRKPILAGTSDLNQAQLIFELVGSPNEENMPGYNSLPGFEGVNEFPPRPGMLTKVFCDLDALAISLLSELLKLNWRKRINAIDALRHPYFRTEPLPAKPHELPRFNDSHELDRRKFRKDGKPAAPPAPAGGSVGMGPNGEWGLQNRPDGGNNYHPRPNRVPNGYGPPRRGGAGPPPYDAPPHNNGSYNNIDRYRGPPPPPSEDHRGLPPKPPGPLPGWSNTNNSNPPHRTDARGPPDQRYYDHDRPPPRGAGGGSSKIDTYIPSYSSDPPPPDDRVRYGDECDGGKEERNVRQGAEIHSDLPS
ncbi:MAG: hypothetical protein Q9227_007564 [Pyrenula ochraceoflavens]